MVRKSCPKLVKVRDTSDKSIEQMNNYLAHQDIMNKLNHDGDANINYNALAHILETGLNRYMPEMHMRFNRHKHKKSNWITRGIIQSIKSRDKLYHTLKKTSFDHASYKEKKFNLCTYNKIPRKIIRQAKFQYYQCLFTKLKNDIKNTWRTINDIINRNDNKSSQIEYLTINQENIYDKQQIVNELNSYFGNIGICLSANIAASHNKRLQDYLNSPFPSDFTFTEITEKNLKDMINNLKSKQTSGPDSISSILLKKIHIRILNP